MLELTVRLVFSLAVVLGLLLLIARISARRFRGQHDSLVQVIHRQPLSRNNAVCVVAVGTRILVLGTTEHQVRVLAELDPDEVEGVEEVEEPGAIASLAVTPPRPLTGGAHRAGARVATLPEDGGALSGSILSPSTWKQALAAATKQAS
ncbi:flagellar biosynthetic protein FliO [Nocardioides pyridinolyticus]